MITAYFMFYDTPLVQFGMFSNRIVWKGNVVEDVSGRPDIAYCLGLSLGEFEAFILSRRVSSGRTNRSLMYFNGEQLSPMEEVLRYRGADMDDNCWIRLEGEVLSYQDVFKPETPVGYLSDDFSVSPRQAIKGNQDKWVSSSGVFKVDHFKGEGLSEYLASLFLESSNCPVPFVPYRLVDDYLCSSVSFKSRYDFIPFAKLLDMHLKTAPYRRRVIEQGGNMFNYWFKNYWNKFSSFQRANFVVSLFESFGVSRGDSVKYLTCMVELDTVILNVDRHFNNFGIMYDNYEKRYVPSLIFDNGISLGVGGGEFASAKKLTDLRRVKMQPFGSRVSVNRRALPEFRFDFDVVKFGQLVVDTCPFELSVLSRTAQFGVLKRRLYEVYGSVDCNGVNILKHLRSLGL